MKKIIAAAVAAAFVAPAFAADVTLSGDVEYKYISTEDGASFDSGDQDVTVTGSEELANGWVVTASLELDGAEDGLNSDSSLSINMGMATVTIGDANDIAQRMIDEKSDKAEHGGRSGEAAISPTAAGADTIDHTLSVTIAPMDGLMIAVSKSTNNDDADATVIDTTSYAVQYSMMGATVAYSSTEVEGQDEDVTGMHLAYATGPISIGYESFSNVGNVADDDGTNLGLAYSYGAGNLYIETGETKDASAGTDVKTTAMGVSYAIGNLNTYLEQNTVKESATADDDQTIVGVEYKF
jgi:hypothetical protein